MNIYTRVFLDECRWKRTERKGTQSKGTRENTPDEKITSEMAPTHK